MMNCTRLFFSNRMSERARTLLINARSSDVDGPSLLKNMKQEMIKKNPVTFTSQKEEEDDKEKAEEEEEDFCKERDLCYETELNSCSSSSKVQQFMHALTTKMMEEGNVELKWSEFEKILATVTTQMREYHHDEEDQRDLKADPEEKENVEDLKDLVKIDMEDVTKEIKEESTNKKKKRTSARVAARTLQNSSSSFSIAASVGQKRRRSSPTAE